MRTWRTPRLSGIIPADAGSTDGRYMLNLYAKDHPRGCGEHPLFPLFLLLI